VLRDQGHPPVVTYSRKVFIPLTNLCRDVCSYCTFARADDDPRAHTMSPDEVLAVAEAGRRRGCKEALFCLGRPARGALAALTARPCGASPPESTHGYLVAMCRAVLEQTGLLPTNAGLMSRRELAELRRGLAQPGADAGVARRAPLRPGGPHEHAPDKLPPPAWR